MGPKNYKDFYSIAPGKEKESITVLANFSASGRKVQPMIVLPYKRIPRDVAESVPVNYFIGLQEYTLYRNWTNTENLTFLSLHFLAEFTLKCK